MSNSKVVQLRSSVGSFEQEAQRIFCDRLKFIRQMNRGELTRQQIAQAEQKLSLDMLAIAKRFGV